MKRLAFGLLLMLALFGCTAQNAAPPLQAQQPSSDPAGIPLPDTTGTAQPDSVSIPLSGVTESARHYVYNSNGVEIRYFAVKGSDGTVRTAFDACEVCYRAGKGYTQVGNDVRCNNCGLSFSIDALGTKNQGKGCWPAYLPNELADDSVIIKKSDLEAGAYLFS